MSEDQPKCVAAWTAVSGSYPEYVNFSRVGDDVRITLREAPFIGENGYLINGNTAAMNIPYTEFVALCADMIAEQG